MKITNSYIPSRGLSRKIKLPYEFWKRFIESELDINHLPKTLSLGIVNYIYEKYFERKYSHAEIIRQNNRILFKYYNYEDIDEAVLQAHLGIVCGIFSKIFTEISEVKIVKSNTTRVFYVKT